MFNKTSNPKLGSLNSGWIPAEYGGGGLSWGNNSPTPLIYSQPYQTVIELPVFPIFSTNVPPSTFFEIPVPDNTNTTNTNNTTNTTNTMSTVNCNCLHGTPIINSDGSCGCRSLIDKPEEATPVKVIDVKDGKPVIYYVDKPANGSTPDFVQTIKDNPILIGAAVLGLILILGNKK